MGSIRGIIVGLMFGPLAGCTTYVVRDFDQMEIRHITVMTDVLCADYGTGDTASVDLSLNLDIGRNVVDSMRELLMEKGYSRLTIYPPSVGSRTAQALHKYKPWGTQEDVFYVIRASDGRDTLYAQATPLYSPAGLPIDRVPPYSLDTLVRYFSNLQRDDSSLSGEPQRMGGLNVLVYLSAYGFDHPKYSSLSWLGILEPFVRLITWNFRKDEICAALSTQVIDIQTGRLLYSDFPEPLQFGVPNNETFLGHLHEVVHDLPQNKMR